MSTTRKPNERASRTKAPAEPIDIDAALARLILLRKMHDLPRPTDYNVYYGGENNPTHTIMVTVAATGAVTRWADALAIRETRRSTSVHSGSEWTNAWDSDWHGWFLTVRATVALTDAPSELDADTVTGLEEIAAEVAGVAAALAGDAADLGEAMARQPLVSDATIAEAEQISKLVPSTDLHLSQAECGCPIKTRRSDGTIFVDHCQACLEAVSA